MDHPHTPLHSSLRASRGVFHDARQGAAAVTFQHFPTLTPKLTSTARGGPFAARGRRSRSAVQPPSRRANAPPEHLLPYRRVALNVIGRAIRDLASPAESMTARAFFAGSGMLHHWCALAELDPASVAARATVLIAELDRSAALPLGQTAVIRSRT